MTNLTEEVRSDPSLPASAAEYRSILVVDDTPSVTHALSRILAAEGYRVIPCLSVAEASAWLDHHDPADLPAAILIDIHLPDGSGLDLAKKARTIFGDQVPVIVLSGDTSIENLRALPDSGATLFFAKPVHVPTLLEKIRAGATTTPT